MQNHRFLALVVSLCLFTSACGGDELVIEPLRGLDGDLATADSNGAPAPVTTVAPPTDTAVDITQQDDAAPEALTFANDNPLCDDIDTVIDAALTADEAVLSRVEAGENSLVGRHLPEELRSASGSAMPITNGAGFEVAWTALDAHTTEACGLPFFAVLMKTSLACADLPDEVAIEFDAGPCLDPRDNPDSIPDMIEVLGLLRALGATVDDSFTPVN